MELDRNILSTCANWELWLSHFAEMAMGKINQLIIVYSVTFNGMGGGQGSLFRNVLNFCFTSAASSRGGKVVESESTAPIADWSILP